VRHHVPYWDTLKEIACASVVPAQIVLLFLPLRYAVGLSFYSSAFYHQYLLTMAPTTALAKRSADSALMPPPPLPKRIKRPPKVLDEDTYTAALSHIIARDFFPGLLESQTQQEFLDALDAGDQGWIEDAGRRVKEVMTPVGGSLGRRGRRGVSMTPGRTFGHARSVTPRDWRGETPISVGYTPSSTDRAQEQEQPPPVDLNMGLAVFQAKYTSEDNESFNKVLDRQNAKRAEKYRWIWNGNKIPSARQIAQAARHQRLLEQSSSTSATTADPLGTTSTALIISQNLDARPASIDPRPSDPRNNIFFTPPDLSESHPTHTSIAQAAQEASTAPPKTVSHISTRFPPCSSPFNSADTVPPSPSLSAIDAAIAGHPYRHPGAPPSTFTSSSSVAGSETPRVNGYAFVDEEPTPTELGVPLDRSPSPTSDSQHLLSQMIAAGSGNGLGPNPFTINEGGKREALHHRMVEKTLKSKRASRIGALVQEHGRTPTPRFMSSPRIFTGVAEATPIAAEGRRGLNRTLRSGNLTPAARMLYDKIGRTPIATRSTGLGVGRAFDGAEEKGCQRWTPPPLRGKMQM